MKIHLFALLLIMAGCAPNYVDYFPYHDDGTMKPHVALMPMLNSTSVELPYDAPAEMTRTIYYDLMDSGQLYLLSTSEIKEGLAKVGKINFFETDQALADGYCNADFIVLIDLIGHTIEPTSDTCTGLSKLVMKARIKVIDARCRQLNIALQEIFVRECMFNGAGVYDDECKNSYYRAHRWFADALSRRLEEVIRSSF